MKLTLNFNSQQPLSQELLIVAAFQRKKEKKGKKNATELVHGDWTSEMTASFSKIKSSKNYTGAVGEKYKFSLDSGTEVLCLGLGEKKEVTLEVLRREFASLYQLVNTKYEKISVMIDAFLVKNTLDESLQAIGESIGMSAYKFDKYLSSKTTPKIREISFVSNEKKALAKKAQNALNIAQILAESINVARDYINEAPNVLTSVHYAKLIKEDIKGTKGVHVKVLGKAELQKEKMGLFLSVNAGSAYAPQLVHLTYTPSKATKKTKHIALVGKGITFDTGGYSLKPGTSMINMKFDMAGSATVYAAFRAIAKLAPNIKVSCILGMTDNAVNSLATMPDSIVKARNGKTVEIANTDAEGRLVLADCLDYTCDLAPEMIIDAATLTGACLVAVGHETCAVMGNNQKLVDGLLASAKSSHEYMWQLPIIPEFRKDIKSPIADLCNIAGNRNGGTAKAAAFLEQFVKNDIAWAHLDIAGIADGQSHLPYCPPKGASGLVIRTLVNFIKQQV